MQNSQCLGLKRVRFMRLTDTSGQNFKRRRTLILSKINMPVPLPFIYSDTIDYTRLIDFRMTYIRASR